MLRRFTKDVGRYKEGQVKDYPRGVWKSIAQSAGMKLWGFTKAISENSALQSTLRGTPRVKPRLGVQTQNAG